MTTKFVETHAIEGSGVPVDINGAGHVGDYYNMKYYGKCIFILQQGAVGGVATPAVTLLQATSAAGAGAKALSFTKRWTKVALTGTVFTETAVASDTYNQPAVANTMNVLEVDAEELDTDNGFTYVSVNVADPAGAGYFLSVQAVLADPRYSGAPGTHLPNPKV